LVSKYTVEGLGAMMKKVLQAIPGAFHFPCQRGGFLRLTTNDINLGQSANGFTVHLYQHLSKEIKP
jgi:hypothetical protein